MDKYEDIINLSYEKKINVRRMPIENRVAQFMPFSALNGHDEIIKEVERITYAPKEIAEDVAVEIDRKLNYIKYVSDNEKEIAITYFRKDDKKIGGNYITIRGKIQGINTQKGMLELNDNISIPLENIADIDVDMEKTITTEQKTQLL